MAALRLVAARSAGTIVDHFLVSFGLFLKLIALISRPCAAESVGMLPVCWIVAALVAAFTGAVDTKSEGSIVGHLSPSSTWPAGAGAL